MISYPFKGFQSEMNVLICLKAVLFSAGGIAKSPI